MKKIITILTLVLVMSGVAFSQGNQNRKSEQITVNVSDLDPALVEQIKNKQSLKEVKQKMSAYGEWVGVGKEIGVAVDGGLSALTKHADNIANTNVGKFTMIMIAYKVLGEDIIGVVFGTFLFLMGTMLFCFIYYRNGLNKKLKEITYAEDGKTILSTKETIKTPEEGAQITYGIAYFVWVGVCLVVIFANGN